MTVNKVWKWVPTNECFCLIQSFFAFRQQHKQHKQLSEIHHWTKVKERNWKKQLTGSSSLLFIICSFWFWIWLLSQFSYSSFCTLNISAKQLVGVVGDGFVVDGVWDNDFNGKLLGLRLLLCVLIDWSSLLLVVVIVIQWIKFKSILLLLLLPLFDTDVQMLFDRLPPQQWNPPIVVCFRRNTFARQMTHRNGNIRWDTTICMVLTKHFRQTTRCPHGNVCIVAFAFIQMTHLQCKVKKNYWKISISTIEKLPLHPV